jgi:peptidoglycan/LPS O-acetylase OafA/YrhL
MTISRDASGPNQSSDNTWDIATDLSWIDLMKGIAIVGVLFDNWTYYVKFSTSPTILYRLAVILVSVGPWVQVFFILSGFGLTVGYLGRERASWSWGRWAWRRFTKIVLPYYVLVILSFLIGVLASEVNGAVNLGFAWSDLLAYITFTRNLFPETWGWNPPMWFMPVIIGLYLSFPLLIHILERWGTWLLLLFSALVTYGTLAAAVLHVGSFSHGADHFTFWMLQFSLGMVLAQVRARSPQKLRHLIGTRAFVLGLFLLAMSWALRTYVPLGAAFNDSMTSVGIFLVLLNVVWVARERIPGTATLLTATASVSYYMFLIHYPLMRLLVPPSLRVPLNPLLVLGLGGVFAILIYGICRLLTRPMNRLSSWAYRAYPAPSK